MRLSSDLGGEVDYCRLTPPGCPIPSFCYSEIKLVKHLNKDLQLNLLRNLIYNKT